MVVNNTLAFETEQATRGVIIPSCHDSIHIEILSSYDIIDKWQTFNKKKLLLIKMANFILHCGCK